MQFLQQILEFILESREAMNHTLIVVGEGDLPKSIRTSGVKVLLWDELEHAGSLNPVTPEVPGRCSEMIILIF